jgi:hypothetical protein
MKKVVGVARKTRLSKMTKSEINAEVKAYRKSAKTRD